MPQEPSDAPTAAEGASIAGEQAQSNGAAAADTPAVSRFPVVGIGASAGGLEAIEALLRRLTAGGMAFVVLQHLAPGHDSGLAEILARSTPMKVATIADGAPVEPNVIHVTPAGVNVSLVSGILRLTPPSPQGARHSIDAFFRSLARDRGTMAIGVVLSGAGGDGTVGLKAIKDEGGIALVQEPGTAVHPSMPENALAAGVVDFCLGPSEIGDELMRLCSHPFAARRPPARVLGDDALVRVFELLRAAYGIDFATYKQSTIERRILRRMALQKTERAEDYLRLLESGAGELDILYSDLLIGVTAFFRDVEPFLLLGEVVFPRLLATRSPERPIRIWVAGCATGEEAYSVAMCLLEYLGDRAPLFKVHIFATDIDDRALERARVGLYPDTIEQDVSAERLQRFFTRQSGGYQISRRLRDMVVFAQHNLGKDPPYSRLDLITCRNVLIYMQPALQRKVLRVFHYALSQDAFLLLGTSESVGDAVDLFTMVKHRIKIYRKRGFPDSLVADVPAGAGGRAAGTGPLAGALEEAPRPAVTIQQLADRKVIERYGPPGVLLNESLEVVQFRGQTGRFLSPSPGTATFNIFKLARPDMVLELRAAIQSAIDKKAPVTTGRIQPWDERDWPVTIDVIPVSDSTARRQCVLVLFRETPVAPVAGAPSPEPESSHPKDRRVVELERELSATKEYLQTTVQELEATNEELQSSNEELQSSNEELQSSNEEMETSKEELQSTNEELATVNDELHDRISQLAVSNDDLQNLLAQLSGSVVIVDGDLRIRRFTASAGRLFHLLPSDAGRPVAHLSTVEGSAQIEQLVKDTIQMGAGRENRVRCPDGHWYTMRVTPYRTADQAVRGAILELVRS